MPEIPLNGGLITQADPEEVGIQGCTELVNAEFDKGGLVYKRIGSGAELLGGSGNFLDIARYVHPDLGTGAEWVLLKDTGEIYHTTDFSSLTLIGDIGTYTANDFAFIDVWGRQIRICGSSTADYPQLLQYVDRDFFWDKVKWDYPAQWNLGNARPVFETFFELLPIYNITGSSDKIISNVYQDADSTANWWLDILDWTNDKTAYDKDKYLPQIGGSVLDLSLDANTREYYYKYSLIIDGINETKLSPMFVSTESLDNDDKATPFFKIRKSDAHTTNIRVTGINIYRKSSVAGSTYKKISTISTLAEDADTNLVHRADANVGQTAFVPGNTHTVSGTAQKLRTMGFTHRLTTNSDNEILKFADDEEGGGGAVSIGWGSGGWRTHNGGVYTDDASKDKVWGEPWAIVYSRNNIQNMFGTYEGTTQNETQLEATGTLGYYENKNGGTFQTVGSVAYRGSNSLSLQTVNTGSNMTGWKVYSDVFDLTTDAYGKTYYADCMATTANLTNMSDGYTSNPGGMTKINHFYFGIEFSSDNSSNANWILNKGGAVSVGNKHTITDRPFHKATNDLNAWEQMRVSAVVPSGKRYCRVYWWFHSDIQVHNNYGPEAGPRWVYVDQLYVGEQLAIGNECYGGPRVVTSSSLDLGINDKVGDLYSVTNNSSNITANSDMGYIAGNVRKALYLERRYSGNDVFAVGINGTSFNADARLFINKDYLWRDGGGSYITDLWFVDKGLTDGVSHPTETQSTKTKFKHSQELNGRQFVGDVTIESTLGKTESHDDWILFSNLGTPDVIPVSNYIQITDLQGGKIKKLGRVLGDLVVFMEKGIFRLSVPNDDPTSWSLVESYPNVGLVSSWGTVSRNGGYFFTSQDFLYYLSPNFELSICSNTIKDVYQDLIPNYSENYPSRAESVELSLDEKNKKLLLTKNGSVSSGYAMDLSVFPSQEKWSKYNFSSNSKGLITDENLDTYLVDWGNSNTSVRKVNSGNGSTEFKRTTGWIRHTDLDDNIILRRLNFRYSSGDDITIKVYTDGDTTTARTWSNGSTYGTLPENTSGSKYIRLRPSIRCKYFMIELSTASSTNTVEINRMEYEVG